MKHLFCMLLLVLMTTTAYAAVEKRYVSDQLWLQMRSGPGNEFRIIKTLSSGSHLIYLEMTEDKKYTKVKNDKITNYLSVLHSLNVKDRSILISVSIILLACNSCFI